MATVYRAFLICNYSNIYPYISGALVTRGLNLENNAEPKSTFTNWRRTEVDRIPRIFRDERFIERNVRRYWSFPTISHDIPNTVADISWMIGARPGLIAPGLFFFFFLFFLSERIGHTKNAFDESTRGSSLGRERRRRKGEERRWRIAEERRTCKW